MDGTLQALTRLSNLSSHRLDDGVFNGLKDVDGGDDEEEYDTETWETITKCFREVQSVLDQNRALIQQVNENHQSKFPDNLVKNVALIRDINSNISKVSRLYSDLSIDFCNISVGHLVCLNLRNAMITWTAPNPESTRLVNRNIE